LAIVENGQAVFDNSDGAVAPWWSFTKTIIAAAVLRLVDDGGLDLDAPDPADGISLRQLLQHTAGLPDYGGDPDYHAAVAAGGTPWTTADLRRRFDGRRLFQPGEGWAYSNIGYLILRERLEALAGGSLADALSRLVFDPLGVDAFLVETPAQAATLPGVIAGYHPGWVFHGLAAGPLVEAARLLDGLLTGRLLSPELTGQMTRSRPLTVPLGDRPWTTTAYGLGLMLPTLGERSWAGHTGGGPSSSVAVYGDRRRIAAAFAPGEDPVSVERAVVEALA